MALAWPLNTGFTVPALIQHTLHSILMCSTTCTCRSKINVLYMYMYMYMCPQVNKALDSAELLSGTLKGRYSELNSDPGTSTSSEEPSSDQVVPSSPKPHPSTAGQQVRVTRYEAFLS